MPQADQPGARTITVGIIARNEAAGIARTIESLSRQTLFAGPHAITVMVIANGCTDETAAVAQAALDAYLTGKATRVEAIDLAQGGKSRTWNRFVHELAPAETELFLFLDADIELAREDACADMLAILQADPHAVACVGHPTKSLVNKPRKSLIDRASLIISENSRADRAINGSLYFLDAAVARSIWLPDETPGEDGFLNAMVRTCGFSRPDDAGLIAVADQTTHYYDPPGPLAAIARERRIVIGTTVNCWIFEHLWSLGATMPVGPLIAGRNRDDPKWVDKLVAERTRGKRWVIPRAVLLWRFPDPRRMSPVRFLAKAPLGAVATAANAVASFRANRVLKRTGAAAFW